jgi:hypothetical protein
VIESLAEVDQELSHVAMRGSTARLLRRLRSGCLARQELQAGVWFGRSLRGIHTVSEDNGLVQPHEHFRIVCSAPIRILKLGAEVARGGAVDSRGKRSEGQGRWTSMDAGGGSPRCLHRVASAI